MKDWKIKQEIYHRLNIQHDDDLSTKDIQISTNIIEDAIKYFNERDLGWLYPAKSYMVAICYAKWIAKEFNENRMDLLNDPDLLHGNDPYFVPYTQDPDTYIGIFQKINSWDFDESAGMVPDVRSYFEKEFML
jgi:hypothetical protein